MRDRVVYWLRKDGALEWCGVMPSRPGEDGETACGIPAGPILESESETVPGLGVSDRVCGACDDAMATTISMLDRPVPRG